MLVGRHLILDISSVPSALLRNEDSLNGAFLAALEASEAQILSYSSHKFPGEGGVTGLFLLAESHASYHSYPEYGYIAIDVFTCGSCRPERIGDSIRTQLCGSSEHRVLLRRGFSAAGGIERLENALTGACAAE